jgi:hypothetical protein
VAMQPFDRALSTAEEIALTVTGWRTGRPSTRPVWFVRDPETLHLLPVSGTDTAWLRSVMKHPTITLTVDGLPWTGQAIPITGPTEVATVVQQFQKKYGADRIAQYYTKLDTAVRVPLG